MTIYGIGRAIVDYYVKGRIDESFMEQAFGQLPEGSLPSPTGRPIHVEGAAFSFILNQISTLDGYKLIRETGGTCVNILKTIGTLTPQSTCFFTGTVGQKDGHLQPVADHEGSFFRSQLESRGIHHQLRVLPGSTGRCLVLPEPGQGWLALASPAVATAIEPEQVRTFLQAVHNTKQTSPAFILVEGMELEKQWLCHQLSSSPLPLVLACGTPFGARMTVQFLQEQFQQQSSSGHSQPQERSFVPLVLANDVEARILEQGNIDFAEWSRNYNILFVITHGASGSSCYFQGTRLFTPATQVAPEQIVDATGAGDTFAGAFLSQLAQDILPDNMNQEKILAAMEYASTAASKIIQVPLCQTAQLCQTNVLSQEDNEN